MHTQPNRRALPKAASEDDLAKEDDASALSLAKHSEKAAPITTSGLPLGKRVTAPSGVTLPAVALTDIEAFENLFNLIRERLDVMEAAADTLVRSSTVHYKNALKNSRIPIVSKRNTVARRAMEAAFLESDAAKRAADLKRAGNAWLGLFIVTQLMQLDLNLALVLDWADKELHQNDPRRGASGHLVRPLNDYMNDPVIVALMDAATSEDPARMTAALPAGIKRYEEVVAFVDRWIVMINGGAQLSSRVLKVADMGMIAISVYQAWKAAPGIFSGGAPTALTVTGLLPGGIAVGSRVSLPSIAAALEGIRKLVAIGALDGAIVGSVGLMGGGSSVTLPELQRPTSLAVQVPGGSTPSTGGGSGGLSSGSQGKLNLPVKKIVNSNMPHASERAVGRAGFSSEKEARQALQEFGNGIEKNGLPSGTIRDTAHADRVIVPGFGKGGAVVYQVSDGTLKLKTVLEWRPPR